MTKYKMFLTIFLVVFCLIEIVSYIFADKLILFPSTNKMSTEGLERLVFQSKNNKQIELYGKVSPKAKYLIIHFIGNKSRAEEDSNLFYTAFWKGFLPEVEIWAVNYPGYGASQGNGTLKEMADSCLEAFDFLVKERGENKQVIIQANSIGTTAGLYVAAERAEILDSKLKALILKNPPALKQMILKENGWWNLYLIAVPVSLKIPKALDSIYNISRLKNIPILFLQSEKDETVPTKYQNMIIDKYTGSKKVVVFKGADHGFLPTRSDNQELNKAFEWLEL